MPAKGAERLPEKEKIVLLHEKVAKKFGSLRKTQYLCTRLQEMVPWMSGLVYGLQNRPRRFESARHLAENLPIWEVFLFYTRFILQDRRCRPSRLSLLRRTSETASPLPDQRSLDLCPSTLSSAHRATLQGRQ